MSAIKPPVEPFRIKVVEPIRRTSRAEREAALQEGRLQRLRHPRRQDLHRPPDRLRDVGHERRPVGRAS